MRWKAEVVGNVVDVIEAKVERRSKNLAKPGFAIQGFAKRKTEGRAL